MTTAPPRGPNMKLETSSSRLSYDNRLAYHLRTLDVCTWWTPHHPSNGSEDMNSETYSSRHFIWYTTWPPDHNLDFLHYMTRRQPNPTWKLRPTCQDLSCDIRHDYYLRNLDFILDDPTPSHWFVDWFENMDFETHSSRPFFWYTTCLLYHSS